MTYQSAFTGPQIDERLSDAETALQPGAQIPWTDVTGKPATFPPEAHGHTVADISDFPALGSAASEDAGAFATAAQGALAEAALTVADGTSQGDILVLGTGTEAEGLPGTEPPLLEAIPVGGRLVSVDSSNDITGVVPLSLFASAAAIGDIDDLLANLNGEGE